MDHSACSLMIDNSDAASAAGLAHYDWKSARQRLIFFFSRRGSSAAEDLAQETIARVMIWLNRGEHTIEGEGGFEKTIYGFARNVLLEQGKRNRLNQVEFPEGLATASNKTLGLNSLEAARLLAQLLGELSKDERNLITAAEFLAPEELARQRGVSIGALRVSLHRAREKLRRMLDSGMYPCSED